MSVFITVIFLADIELTAALDRIATFAARHQTTIVQTDRIFKKSIHKLHWHMPVPGQLCKHTLFSDYRFNDSYPPLS